MTLKYITIMDYFTENQNTAIYTTKYIIDQGSPILNVYHYKDGSWQFSGKETALQDEDFRIISLDEILSLDATLKVLRDAPAGCLARRETNNGDWEIELISYNLNRLHFGGRTTCVPKVVNTLNF